MIPNCFGGGWRHCSCSNLHGFQGELPALQEAFALIEAGQFSRGDRDLFRPLLDRLRGQDPFFVLADFDDYVQAQCRVDEVWLDRRRWMTMSLLNTARSGYFSSDRAIRDYASSIWKIHPLTATMTSGNA